MPLSGRVFDAVFISVSMPLYQKPSRSNLSIRELFVLWAAPRRLSGVSLASSATPLPAPQSLPSLRHPGASAPSQAF